MDGNRQIKARKVTWAGHVTRMERREKCTGFWVGKPEGKRPLGRPRRRWEDGITMDLRKIGWEEWSGFSWLRIGADGGLLGMR
jgi:hypothetical protein